MVGGGGGLKGEGLGVIKGGGVDWGEGGLNKRNFTFLFRFSLSLPLLFLKNKILQSLNPLFFSLSFSFFSLFCTLQHTHTHTQIQRLRLWLRLRLGV